MDVRDVGRLGSFLAAGCCKCVNFNVAAGCEYA